MNESPFPYPWHPDNGDGTYSNPVIHADYSDPDVIRHGEDYWMVASSFNCTPGLPILHSKDLVNWTLVNHAISRIPHPSYAQVRNGCGVWAPAIRFHAGKFWIFFPMPDEGIYVTTARDPAGPWEVPWCLAEARGWIDPCPFWDEDGKAYLVHAYAMSRSGLKERIHLRPMSPDGRSLTGECKELFHTPHHLYLEGPKVHKFGEWYYILCPGGGVQTGWQVVFRSKNLEGPYEEKVVLEQGSTAVNGPHQGALVDAPDGSWWFLHFQDCGPFGRIVHLQPVRWEDGWPLMGEDLDGNGIGEPVARWTKPPGPPAGPPPLPNSGEFRPGGLAREWQWNANHEDAWSSLCDRPGWLRLSGATTDPRQLALCPRLLGQKFPARSFAASVRCDVSSSADGSVAGLAVPGGGGFAAIGLRHHGGLADLVVWDPEQEVVVAANLPTNAQLAVSVEPDGAFAFAFRQGPGPFTPIDRRFQAREGGWIGAKVALFHLADDPAYYADFADFGFLPGLPGGTL